MNSWLTLTSGLRRPSAPPWRNIRHLRESRRPYSGSPSWRSPNSPSSGQSAAAPLAVTSIHGLLERSQIWKLAGAYSRLQARRPYATQVCSTVVIWLCGDLSAQLLFPAESTRDGNKHLPGSEETRVEPTGSHSYDPWRTARHLTVGIVASIPSYEWFMFLHRHFNFTSKIASLLTKVVVQQAVYTPVFNTYFFTAQSLLSGASMDETLMRLKLALPTSIVNSIKVWSGVAFVSFLWVPPQFRSVFSGCVAVCWQMYLSWMHQTVANTVHRAD